MFTSQKYRLEIKIILVDLTIILGQALFLKKNKNKLIMIYDKTFFLPQTSLHLKIKEYTFHRIHNAIIQLIIHKKVHAIMLLRNSLNLIIY